MARVVPGNYHSYHECVSDLQAQGCTSIGWLNSGTVKIPEDTNFVNVFHTMRGTAEVYCDLDKGLYYCVDEGD